MHELISSTSYTGVDQNTHRALTNCYEAIVEIKNLDQTMPLSAHPQWLTINNDLIWILEMYKFGSVEEVGENTRIIPYILELWYRKLRKSIYNLLETVNNHKTEIIIIGLIVFVGFIINDLVSLSNKLTIISNYEEVISTKDIEQKFE